MKRLVGTVGVIAGLLGLGCVTAPAPTQPGPEAGTAETVVQAVEIPNARTPKEGLLTGGQPSEDDLRRAAAAGYKTVINLRTEGEPIPFDERALVEQLGMDYVSIPIAGADDLTAARAEELAGILASEESHPAMVHCASGNRVGALLALKAFLVDGQSAEEALDLGRRAGLTRLEPAVEELLER